MTPTTIPISVHSHTAALHGAAGAAASAICDAMCSDAAADGTVKIAIDESLRCAQRVCIWPARGESPKIMIPHATKSTASAVPASDSVHDDQNIAAVSVGPAGVAAVAIEPSWTRSSPVVGSR